MNRNDFLYATGVIRSLEYRLLDGTDIERMVDAPDAEGAFKVFHDTDFGAHIGDRSVAQYNDALKENLARVMVDIRNMTSDADFLMLLFGKRDLHNVKTLWKEHVSGEKTENVLSELGNETNIDAMRTAIETGVVHGLHEEVAEWILEARTHLTEQSSARAIDFVLDRAYLRSKRRLAERLKLPFITQLVQLQEDVQHMKLFIRAKLLGRDSKWFKEHLLRDSAPYNSTFLNAYDKDILEGLQDIRDAVVPQLKPAIDAFREKQDLAALEKNAEDAEIEYLREAKQIAYGPEVVLAYYYAKRNAIRNVRLIMTGKIAKVNPEELKTRVRKIY